MLGDALVASGAITASQLVQALADQRATGALLGETLLALHLISEEALARALAQEAGVPYAVVTDRRPETSAVSLVPEPFARKHLLAPLELKGSVLHVIQANPFDVLALDDLRQLIARPIATTCATTADVRALLDRGYAHGDNGERERDDVLPIVRPPDASVETRILERLVNDAVRGEASDLHIEPGQDSISVRYRIDGVLLPGQPIPIPQHAPLVAHIKALGGLDGESRAAQEGRTSHVVNGRRVDLLVATQPTVAGETIAIRLLDKGRTVQPLSELGFSRTDLTAVTGFLKQPRGLVLIAGPAGSGSTTSLYSMLAHLAHASRNVLTIEDPVECQIPSIRQMQIRPKAGFTFDMAMRSALRQDPDVIMLGAIPDPETAQMAVRAALSGVLVLSTLPTTDAATAVSRLTDMGLEPYLLASGLEGVIAQRLIRLICPDCKERVSYPVGTLQRAGLKPDPGLTFHRGRGCANCRGTGYRGRTGVFEVMRIDARLQSHIRDRADARAIKQAAIEGGMKTLLEDAIAKTVLQQTTIEEVIRVM